MPRIWALKEMTSVAPARALVMLAGVKVAVLG